MQCIELTLYLHALLHVLDSSPHMFYFEAPQTFLKNHNVLLYA